MRQKINAFVFSVSVFCFTPKAKADLWGGDIPLLIKIVTNTMRTYSQLRSQTNLLRKELRGIDDRIRRFETIQDIIAPDDLQAWRNPRTALRKLQQIYYTLPPEFRTKKSDDIERRISQAMSVAGMMSYSADRNFRSGKQLEDRALKAGPAVANKMTASGVGSLVAIESQNLVAQATIISLLSQMISESASKEAARLKSQKAEFSAYGTGLRGFSKHVNLMEVSR